MRVLRRFILVTWFSCLASAAFAAESAPPLAAAAQTQDDQYVRTKLSTLWTVQSFNITATDVLSSFIPEWRGELVRFT